MSLPEYALKAEPVGCRLAWPSRRIGGPLAAIAILAAATTPALSQQGAAEASGTKLAPHRAVYEITLAETRGATGITELSGRMVYELTGSACTGYTQTMRFVTRMTSQEGATSLTDMRTTSWEDALAKAFRFNSTQYKDAKLEETTDGGAARSGPGGEVKVDITKPAKKAISLDRDTFFPVQHSIALLDAARKGDTFFVANLYDGSEKGEKVYLTASFIGKPKPAGYNRTLGKAENVTELDGLKSWPVSISYYEDADAKKDGVPAYELAFLYFDNGVSRRLFIDYGEFAVDGKLQKLEFLKPAKCDGR